MTWLPRQRVIVPVDFSDDAFAAVDVAIDLANSASSISLLHILAELIPLDPADNVWQADDAARVAQAKDRLRQRFAEDRYQGLTFDVLIGDPGHSIANYAGVVGADLIVMPSHGRRGMSRLLLGSVAERVLRLAHCPVLILRK